MSAKKRKGVIGRGEARHVQRVPGGEDDYTKAAASELLPANVLSADDLDQPEQRERKRKFADSAGVGHISRKPHLDNLLSSAYITCHEVLKRCQKQAELKFGDLDAEELRAFTKIAGDVLPKLIREEREQQKAEGLDDMDIKDLIEASEAATKLLSGGTE